MATEYLNLEDVLKELQIDDNELKQLVSDGDLRSFRDSGVMKFKREDVLKVKKGRETEPTIILTDSDQAIGTEESSDELILDEGEEDQTILNIDDIVEEAAAEQEGIGLVDPDEEDAIVPTVEVPALEDEDDEDMHVPSVELEEEEDAEEVAPKSTSASRVQRSARLRAMQIQERSSNLTWTLCLVVTSIFLIPVMAIYINTLESVEPVWISDVTGFFRSIGEGVWSIFA
ncbi:MAG: hypothetical protein O7H41_04665 [Planctomycetota bacterium]|nr:hypothetical protein [Planctomycetota bacterium]